MKEREREIVICPKCGYVGSFEKGHELPGCPKCGVSLINTKIALEKWQEMSADEKAAEKQKVLENASEISKNSTLSMEQYLAKIEQNTKTTANWVAFLGAVVLISLIIAIIGQLLQ